MAGPIVPWRVSTDTGFTSSSACGYGNPRSRTAFTVLKMAVFAPMPRASTSSATAANPRLLFNVRKAKRTSWVNAILDPACQSGEHARGDNLRPSRETVVEPLARTRHVIFPARRAGPTPAPDRGSRSDATHGRVGW